MPARITITESDTQEVDEYWIENDVIRIGSDPQCECCLEADGLESHAITLRYAGNQYTAYNRGKQSIQIEDVAIGTNQSRQWRGGESLQLTNGLALLLEIFGDSKPGPPPAELVAPAASSELSTASDEAAESDELDEMGEPLAAPASSSQVGQMLLVCLLIAAAAAIVLWPENSSDSALTPRVSFSQLVPKLQASTRVSPDLWVRLSQAYAAKCRRQNAGAQRAFQNLRDLIELEKEKFTLDGMAIPEELTDLEEYVKSRLGRRS